MVGSQSIYPTTIHGTESNHQSLSNRALAILRQGLSTLPRAGFEPPENQEIPKDWSGQNAGRSRGTGILGDARLGVAAVNAGGERPLECLRQFDFVGSSADPLRLFVALKDVEQFRLPGITEAEAWSWSWFGSAVQILGSL